MLKEGLGSTFATRPGASGAAGFEQEGGFWGRHAKSSLGNTLRLLRPLVILDEGHKAYSRNARATLEGFNPCMVVELSATPPRGANLLVDIRGRELNEEEMIKLDLHIRNSASTSRKHTLRASIEHRRRLKEEARAHEANTGVYIHPICLIQVERTGRAWCTPKTSGTTCCAILASARS